MNPELRAIMARSHLDAAVSRFREALDLMEPEQRVAALVEVQDVFFSHGVPASAVVPK